MQGKRVFVSGGAGVIGSEMIPRLVNRGAIVFTGDLKPRPEWLPAEISYRQGDLNYLSANELGSFAPEIFIHLAATFERSTETYGFWRENFRHNVLLSHHLMTLAKDLPGLRRVVFASSYLIYEPDLYQFDEPRVEPVRLRESDPVRPRNLTGMAKFAHEMELSFLNGFRSQQFSTICARIFRGYGRNSRDVISRWIRMLLKNEPIEVYCPEGIFDYIYAADSAEGLIRLADSDRATGIVNLGTGNARRVQEVVDTLKLHFPDMRATIVPSDIPFEASEADLTAYQAAIGWHPEYDIERAIPEIIQFERDRMNGQSAPVCARSAATILVSSASKKAPLVEAVRHAARKTHPDIRVTAGDLDANAPTRYLADDFWNMPPTTDGQLPSIIKGCQDRGIQVVIPTRDGELAFWARHQAALAAAGIQVVVSSLAAIELCRDKLAFAQFGQSRGFPFIPATEYLDELTVERFVVKERFGAGSRGIGLNLDREAALAHSHSLKHPIFQPLVEGFEISVDGWLDRCQKVKGLVLRRRNSVINGESQITTTFRNADLEAQIARVLEALGLRGPIVLQALVDRAGALHIIECNPRFGGASTTAIAAGLDPFYWSLLESQGVDVSAYPFPRIAGEVRQVRVPADLYYYDPRL
jgi:carbamoyl-phosphate synthase large subunit